MSKLFVRFGVAAAAASLLATAAVAAPVKAKKADAPKCPKCHMALTAKKDKQHPVAVKVHGKTFYCCNKCAMNAPAKKKK